MSNCQTPTVTGIGSEDVLREYKRQVYRVAREVKEDQDWCDTGFEKAMRDLGIDPAEVYVEPSPGSVVLNPYSSHAFIRNWAGRGWDRTGRASQDRLTWDDVMRACNGQPIVLLETNGVSGYSQLRNGTVEGIKL